MYAQLSNWIMVPCLNPRNSRGKIFAQNLNEGNFHLASLWKAFRVATEKSAKLDKREEISAKRKVKTTKKTLRQAEASSFP